MNEKFAKQKGCRGCFFAFLAVLSILLLTIVPFRWYYSKEISELNAQSAARCINGLFNAYSVDHEGKYPEGKTSTEVFQKLIDGGYVTDPANPEAPGVAVFYFPMPGKIKPDSKQLKPENVSFDVTCCVDSSSPDELPVVFLTGYKVTYQQNGSAIPKNWPARSWAGWWKGLDHPRGYIAVAYKGAYTEILKATADGTLPNFIPAKFDPKGKVYRQLTPEGELPP